MKNLALTLLAGAAVPVAHYAAAKLGDGAGALVLTVFGIVVAGIARYLHLQPPPIDPPGTGPLKPA